jgi:hypothetical protein
MLTDLFPPRSNGTSHTSHQRPQSKLRSSFPKSKASRRDSTWKRARVGWSPKRQRRCKISLQRASSHAGLAKRIHQETVSAISFTSRTALTENCSFQINISSSTSRVSAQPPSISRSVLFFRSNISKVSSGRLLAVSGHTETSRPFRHSYPFAYPFMGTFWCRMRNCGRHWTSCCRHKSGRASDSWSLFLTP